MNPILSEHAALRKFWVRVMGIQQDKDVHENAVSEDPTALVFMTKRS